MTIGDIKPNAPLSPREVEVLQLISKGFTNEQVAGFMHLSINTVAEYVRRATIKLDACNRVEAACRAIREGIIA